MDAKRESRRARAGLSLRALATAGGVGLTSVALVACAALILLTTVLRHDTQRVETATAGIRSADTLRVTLLSYARESDLAYLTRDSAFEATREQTALDLRAQLADTQSKARGATQRGLIEDAQRRIDGYLDARRQAEQRRASLQDVLAAATTPLQSALTTLQQLVAIDYRAVADAQQAARRWDAIGRVAGSVIGLLMLIGFVAGVISVRRFVLAPLLSLSDGINRFAAGDVEARVTVGGSAEFARTASAFNDMAKRLAQQDQERRLFLAGVAHDLRNPLTALRMRVQMIERAAQLPAEPQIRSAFTMVGRQLSKLERMVGDFLDARQVVGGHFELDLQSSDLRDAAGEVVELYRPVAQAHTLSLFLPEHPVTVRCDPFRIAQVLNNLVSNAIKYSPHGGEVAVRLSEDDRQAVIAVTDRGIGIPADEIGRVFEPFHRGTAARETIPGIGLGLSVARRLVEAHGGRLELESKVGLGTTFRLRLPRSSVDG